MSRIRILRKPMDSQRTLNRRQRILVLTAVLALGVAGALALLLAGCGGPSSGAVTPSPPAPSVQPLQAADVQAVVQAAVDSANVDMVVAVVDRAGFVLGVYRTANAPGTAKGNFSAT